MTAAGPGSGPVAVLVVEDDENLRIGLRDNLEDEGYEVGEAADVAAARALTAARAWDVIVLDVMLPDGDGYSLCAALRAAGSSARVLMLTARTLEEDVVRGLDSGADDYVSKPYRLAELLARVRALARRPATAPPLSLGPWRIETAARQVRSADGEVVELTRTEFDLLVHLLRSEGRALRRFDILAAVWGTDVIVDPRTVDNFVHNLKRKLDWTGDAPWRIRTVRGVGYRLEIDPPG